MVNFPICESTDEEKGMPENEPRGPSIETVGLAETAECRPFLGICGSMTVKLTSGGIVKGALPT